MTEPNFTPEQLAAKLAGEQRAHQLTAAAAPTTHGQQAASVAGEPGVAAAPGRAVSASALTLSSGSPHIAAWQSCSRGGQGESGPTQPLSLFDQVPGAVTPDPAGARTLAGSSPAARFTDPATSHHAAARPRDKAAIHARVLELLADGPLTDFDLARLTGLKQTSVGVRRGELAKAGLVVAHDHSGVSDTGSACIRWALTAAGLAAHNNKEHAA